jgi:hypothetical protein
MVRIGALAEPERDESRTPALPTPSLKEPIIRERAPKVKPDAGVVQIVRKYMATKHKQWAHPNTQPDYLLCVGLLKKYGEDD